MNTNEMEQLLRKAMDGDEEAVNVLFGACMTQLRGTAARFFRNREDVEDVVQESLLSAYRNFRQYEGRAKFSTWLHRITINEALMELRRRKIRTMISLDEAPLDEEGFSPAIPLPDPAPNPEAEYSRKEGQQFLDETLDKIPAAFRTALRTYYFQELTTKEGASVLGITMANFKSRLYHARRALLKSLRQTGFRRSTRRDGVSGVRREAAKAEPLSSPERKNHSLKQTRLRRPAREEIRPAGSRGAQ